MRAVIDKPPGLWYTITKFHGKGEERMDLCDPAVIRELMQSADTGLKKAFGQNFLIRREIPERIAEECTDEKNSLILEIGPGIGCLTQELALRYTRVAAIEIDRTLIPILSQTLTEYDNVTVLNEDVMKVDLPSFLREQAGDLPVSVCANLPYYITTPILMRLLESGVAFRSITVMVQAEVAARLCAAPGSPDYGAITAVLGFYGQTRKLFSVTAGNFLPAPKVDSAVVRMDLYPEKKYLPKDEKLFFGLIRAAFAMRRKTLVNAISAAYPFTKEQIACALAKIGLSASVRGERLSTGDYCALADALYEIRQKSE